MYEKNQERLKEMSLRLLEHSIRNEVKKHRFWGELPYTKEDYISVHERLKAYFGEDVSEDAFLSTFKIYPHAFITDLTRFALYEYDGGSFWGLWTEQFGLSLTQMQHSEIGKLVRMIYKSHNLEIVDEGGYTYVTPILYQSGMPNFSIKRLFDLLWPALGLPYFDDNEFYEEVTGFRNYLLDKTGLRYFNNKESALNLISEIRSLMEFMRDIESIKDIPVETGFNKRYLETFVDWKHDIKRRKKSSVEHSYYYVAPKLFYDDMKGICLKLPSQVIADDSVYNIYWHVKCDSTNEEFSYVLPVYTQNRQNLIEEGIIAVPPSTSYSVTIYDDDNRTNPLYRSWTIHGENSEVPYLLFSMDANGNAQSYVSQKGSILVRSKEVLFANKQEFEVYPYTGLTYKWQQYHAELIIPKNTSDRAVLSLSGNTQTLEVKKTIDFELVQLHTLFDETYASHETPVFVRFPSFEIEETYDVLKELHSDAWKVELKNKKRNQKEEFYLGDCAANLEKNSTRFAIPNDIKSKFQEVYGEYELRITSGRNFTARSFYCSPSIEYRTGLHLDPSSSGVDIHGFYVKGTDDIQVQVDSHHEIREDSTKGNGWLQIRPIHARALVQGMIKLNLHEKAYEVNIPFKKQTGLIEWRFWDEVNDTDAVYGIQRFDLKEIKEGRWNGLLSLAKNYDQVRIALVDSGNQMLQEIEMHKDRKGNCKFELNHFVDTMESYSLPQRIMVYVSNEVKPLCLAIIRKKYVLEGLGYQKIQGKPVLYWSNEVDAKGKTMTLIPVSDPDTAPMQSKIRKIHPLQSKTEGKYVYGMVLSKEPVPGLHLVELDEGIESFFFDEEVEQAFIYESERVVSVNIKKPEEFIDSCNTIKSWANAYLSLLKSRTDTRKIHDAFLDRIKREIYTFHPREDISIFLRLMTISHQVQQLHGDVVQCLREFCAEVNQRFISAEDRTWILKKILSEDLSREQFIRFECDLQLFLINRNGEALLSKEEMRRLWEFDEKLAILAALRGLPENRLIDINKLLLHLNAPMLKKHIEFAPLNKEDSQDWTDCFESTLTGVGGCKHLGFPATEKFWGSIEDLNNMLSISHKSIEVNKLSDIPSDGYDFLGSNYLSLVYRWVSDQSNKEKELWREAIKYGAAVKNMVGDRLRNYRPILKVLGKRKGAEGKSMHEFMYSVGIASLLEASMEKHQNVKSDFRSIHKFWDYAFRAFPRLVMRDLIISELYVIFNRNARREMHGNESHSDNQDHQVRL